MFSHSDPFLALHEALDRCAAAPIDQWSDAGVADAVKAWAHATSRLAGVGARLLTRWDHTDGWTADGAANATQWLNHWGQVDLASRHLRVARNLHRYAPLTSAALEADELPYAKAAALALAVTDETAASFALNEEVLVKTAKQVSLRQTHRLLSRWKAVAESEQHPDVDPEEVRRDRRYLHIHETFDGMIAIEGLLDPEVGAVLKEVIEGITNQLYRQDVRDARNERAVDEEAARDDDAHGDDPAGGTPTGHEGCACHDHGGSGSDTAPEPGQGTAAGEPENDDTATDHPDPDDAGIPDNELGRTAAQRRADALAEALERVLACSHLLGGPRSHLHITATWEQLQEAATPRHTSTSELRLPPPATFDPDADPPPHTDLGLTILPGALARAACDSIISRLILDANGVPLDLGREQRLASPAQRRALAERDDGCAFPDCDRDLAWCDAHHIVPWQAGGLTDLDNLVLLCRTHHTRMHQRDPWTCRMDPDTRRPCFYRPDGRLMRDGEADHRWHPPSAENDDPNDPPDRPPDTNPAWVTAA